MSEQSLVSQALRQSIILALMIIPTAVSIFVALEVKNVGDLTNAAVNGEPQIVCFDADVCAIEVHGKWYRIDGVISMEDTVPEEYKLEELLSEVTDNASVELPPQDE
tara:strand:- start:113 stop:433 length:321 start_codon:yes stop_codon:yes gene_type:complete